MRMRLAARFTVAAVSWPNRVFPDAMAAFTVLGVRTVLPNGSSTSVPENNNARSDEIRCLHQHV